jgi:mono/diheme cytochrome c family protein
MSLESRTGRPALLCLLLAAATVAGCSGAEEAEVEAPAVEEGAASALVERGEYLVEGIAGCGNCHTPRDANGQLIADQNLAGGFVIEEAAFTSYAPNITPHQETGIGSWSDEEIMRAVREGVHPSGRILGPPMSFAFYRGISDSDIRAIVAYLRSVPSVDNVVPRSEFNIPLPESWGPPLGQVPDVSPDDPVAYGEYLAGPVGHCIDCHTPLVEGQLALERVGEGGNTYENPFGRPFVTTSSNITSNETVGIGAWSDDEIKRAITDGVSAGGRELLPFMGFSFYRNISDEDLDAIVAYLRTLPPQPPEG